MDESIDDLWSAFGTEVTEQLEALDTLISGDGRGMDINSVFRLFHTIKSSSGMLGLRGMEALAHAAEDLLDHARNNRLALDGDICATLLASVDALREMLGSALATHQPPPASDDVTRLVTRLRARAAGCDAAPDAAAAGQSAAQAATQLPESEAVRGCAALSATVLPPIVDAALQDGAVIPELPVATLREAAQEIGLLVIDRLLARLAALPADARMRERVLSDLLVRVRHAEQLSRLDFGAAEATAIAGDRLRARWQTACAQARGTCSGHLGERADAERWLAALREPLALAEMLDLEASRQLLRYASQVLRDMTRGSVPRTADLVETLSIAIGLPADIGEALVEDEPYAAFARQLQDSLQALIAAPAQTDGEDSARQIVLQALDIDEELLESIAPGAMHKLATAIGNQQTIVEIEADLEATADGGEDFVSWIDRVGSLVSNRTFFRRQRGYDEQEHTRLGFLCAFSQPLEQVRRALTEFDNDAGVFHLHPIRKRNESREETRGDQGRAISGQVSTVRIDSAALDQFANRVGEMVMLRNMLSHSLQQAKMQATLRRLRDRARATGDALAHDAAEALQMMTAHFDSLRQVDDRLSGTLARLQSDMLDLRVIPMGVALNRMNRIARSVAQAQGKSVRLLISGEEVRVDKSIVDLLAEPLMHMVRNAVDHGIEPAAERAAAGKDTTATITLSARQQGGGLLLQVGDDGRGLDIDRIRARALAMGLPGADSDNAQQIANLVFTPGFSTAEQVSEISGRGVGMDVVRTRITQLGGKIEIQTTPGKGTRFLMHLPLSVALQHVVLVHSADNTLALPERSVLEFTTFPRDQLQIVQAQAAALLRGVVLPLYRLDGLLLTQPQVVAGEGGDLQVVVITDGINRIGLIVDRVVGRREVFVRDIHPDLLSIPGIGGASLLGDGSVVVILDCERLLGMAARNTRAMRTLLAGAG